MKKIGRKNMEEFSKIKENEWFEYYNDYPNGEPCLGVKINENFVAFINGNMRFFVGKVYKDSIFMGNIPRLEYTQFSELIEALSNKNDIIDRFL